MGGANRGRFSNKELDAMIASALVSARRLATLKVVEALREL